MPTRAKQPGDDAGDDRRVKTVLRRQARQRCEGNPLREDQHGTQQPRHRIEAQGCRRNLSHPGTEQSLQQSFK
jgi:hypothetical protein